MFLHVECLALFIYTDNYCADYGDEIFKHKYMHKIDYDIMTTHLAANRQHPGTVPPFLKV